jgi:hypothetical protein
VKSIIKSATYKTFDETCADYLSCLRQEISAKMGPSVITSESSLRHAGDDQASTELKLKDEDLNRPTGEDEGFVEKLFSFVLRYRVHILLCVVAFFLGRFGPLRAGRSEQVMSSYDLEMEILREFNVSQMPSSVRNRVWIDSKFQRSHFQLDRLHDEFALVRKSIWYTLQRVNDLERRIYRAQVAALLGDRLLACYDGENPACLALREQWKNLIKDK